MKTLTFVFVPRFHLYCIPEGACQTGVDIARFEPALFMGSGFRGSVRAGKGSVIFGGGVQGLYRGMVSGEVVRF